MKTPNIEFYRKAKADFIAQLIRRRCKKWEELNNEISMYCACFGLPVIAAIEFIAEEPAFDKYKSHIDEKRKVIQEFYGYDV